MKTPVWLQLVIGALALIAFGLAPVGVAKVWEATGWKTSVSTVLNTGIGIVFAAFLVVTFVYGTIHYLVNRKRG